MAVIPRFIARHWVGLLAAAWLITGCGSASAPDGASVKVTTAGSARAVSAGPEASPWPGAMHDARHSGTPSATSPRSGHVRWNRDLDGNVTPGRSWGIWTAPAIDSTGAAYYGTRSGHAFGVSANGVVLFDLDIGGTVDSYPAIDADGTLYIGTSTGEFYAIGADAA